MKLCDQCPFRRQERPLDADEVEIRADEVRPGDLVRFRPVCGDVHTREVLRSEPYERWVENGWIIVFGKDYCTSTVRSSVQRIVRREAQ